MPALRNYELSLKNDHRGEHTQVIMALSAAKAKFEFWDTARRYVKDVTWSQVRCKSLGLAYAQKPPADERERRTLELLRHALGLDHLGLNQQGGIEGHRDYYASYRDGSDWDFLMDLCSSKGRMPLLSSTNVDKLAAGMVYFHVTIGGSDFVRRRTGVDHREKTSRIVKSYKGVPVDARLSTDGEDALATARGECLLGDGPQIPQIAQMDSLPRVNALEATNE